MMDNSMPCIYENVVENASMLDTLTKTLPSQENLETLQKPVGLGPALEVAIRSVNSMGKASKTNSKQSLKPKKKSKTASNARSASQ